MSSFTFLLRYIRAVPDILTSILYTSTAERQIVSAATIDVLRTLVTVRQPADAKWVYSFLPYRHTTVHALIHELKYKRNKKSAQLAAEIMWDHAVMHFGDEIEFHAFDDPLIVPVPASSTRKAEQGFSHMNMVANELHHISNGAFSISTKALRAKNTKKQSSIKSKAERKDNIKGSFFADNSIVRGRNILLIDDVVTTGSTMNEAQKALYAAGARKVRGYAVAH